MSTLVNTETGEMTEPMDADTARRLTERIRIAASNYTEAKAKVLQLVDEAKAGSAHIALGYKSWTAYLSDVLSDEPLRLAREDRQELNVRLADEGMTVRAIAPITGTSPATVNRDIQAADRALAVSSETASPAPIVRTSTGLDGRERTTAAAGTLAKPTPTSTGTARAYQEADVVNAFRSMARELTKPKNVASLSPKARTLLVELLEHAIATLKGTDQ